MKIQIILGAPALVLGACSYQTTPLPTILAQQAITDPKVASSDKLNDPFEGYTNRSVSGPRDWRTVNKEQTETH